MTKEKERCKKKASLGGEAFEVGEANLAPLFGVLELMLETDVDLLPALGVDVGLGLVPNADEVLNLVDSTSVVILHLLVDCATTLETIAPGNAVEPQQITLGTGVDVVVYLTVWLAILSCGVRTSVCAVETDRVVIGLVIVNRAPLDRIAWDESIGLGTIVLVEGEDMMQTDWHHVVDASFAASQHDAEEFCQGTGTWHLAFALGCFCRGTGTWHLTLVLVC